jgi:hypothetical protein
MELLLVSWRVSVLVASLWAYSSNKHNTFLTDILNCLAHTLLGVMLAHSDFRSGSTWMHEQLVG